jgi:uncharacterized protein (DUF488 family)
VTIYTIGHSTRSLDEFLGLLKAHGVGRLADIRTLPGSRRHPHFARAALQQSLAGVGMAYRHFAGLGGLRKPRPDSANAAWRQEGFRGYADYMETPEFDAALTELIEWAGESPNEPSTAIMCAEAVWWRCHRQLTADALVARGVGVRHITSHTAAPLHRLTKFAQLEGHRVTYPVRP